MALECHLERKLRFNASSEYKSLYSWSIGEFDEFGKPVGRDQIPWRWTLYFTATEIVLHDHLDIKAKNEVDDPPLKQEEEVTERRSIHATLRPGDHRSDRDWFRRTTFKMFGTDREVKDFTLEIYPLASDDENEECTAWGIVSYDTNDDFHPETTDDIVGFYLMVKPSTFQRYVDRISAGTADEIVLSVKRVKGFYSEWSPDTFTRDVKVLCAGDDQHVEMPAGTDYDLPRLHEVGEAQLYVNAKRAQAKRRKVDDPGADKDEPSAAPLVRPEVAERVTSPVADPQFAKLLRQISTLARWIIGLLIVLIIVTLWSR